MLLSFHNSIKSCECQNVNVENNSPYKEKICMRNFIMAAVAALSLIFSSTVSADPNLEVSVFSRQVWRGVGVVDVVSVQPSLTVPFDSTGTSINVWGQIPFHSSTWAVGHPTEYDFTVSQEVGDYGTAHLISYFYPNAETELLNVDDHDIELGFSTEYAGVDFYVGRFVKSPSVEGDTYAQVSYPLFGFDATVGGGNGLYTKSGDFGVSNVALSYGNDDGYGASFIYNPDVSTTHFVVSKTW